jgi:hypothetical protein
LLGWVAVFDKVHEIEKSHTEQEHAQSQINFWLLTQIYQKVFRDNKIDHKANCKIEFNFLFGWIRKNGLVLNELDCIKEDGQNRKAHEGRKVIFVEYELGAEHEQETCMGEDEEDGLVEIGEGP